MERGAGAVMVVLGALILAFGNAIVRRNEQPGLRWSRAALVDTAFKWGMGLLCLWFGLGLVFGTVHFE